MDEDVGVGTIEEQGDLDLEKFRMLLENQFASKFGGSGDQSGVQGPDLLRGKIVNC